MIFAEGRGHSLVLPDHNAAKEGMHSQLVMTSSRYAVDRVKRRISLIRFSLVLKIVLFFASFRKAKAPWT